VFVLLEMELVDMKERVNKRHDGEAPMEWLEVNDFLSEQIFITIPS
jgi:hypothetical protein